MSQLQASERTDLMAQVWSNTEAHCSPLSPLLATAKGALTAAASEDFGGMRLAVRHASERIGRHTGKWVDEPVFIGVYEGEWTVTADDLETWRYVRMWGSRLYPGWNNVSREITEAIEGKRRWQTYQRFSESGVTHEHKLLAAALNWEFDFGRGDWVSLYVQGKRPFGNSGIVGDIAHIVGWDQPWRDDEDWDGDLPAEFTERAWCLFEELQFAVPLILRAAAESSPTPAHPE